MLTHDYTYTDILDRSVNNAWTVEDCYGGRDFDFTRGRLRLQQRVARDCVETGRAKNVVPPRIAQT